ncbi:MAG: hypothetical protein ACT4PJ_13890 [Gemmatimonadaceae bacterium]
MPHRSTHALIRVRLDQRGGRGDPMRREIRRYPAREQRVSNIMENSKRHRGGHCLHGERETTRATLLGA